MSDRTSRAVVLAALALVLGTLLYFQEVESARAASRRVGFTWDRAAPGMLITGVLAGLPGARAGLRAGDKVFVVDGRRVDSANDYQAISAHFRGGQPVVFSVLRAGKRLDFRLLPGAPFPWINVLINTIGALCYFALAWLAARQGVRTLQTRLLFGFTAAVALELALPTRVIGHPRMWVFAQCAYYLLTGIQIGLELHLASVIPERHGWLARHPWVVRLYYAVGLSIGVGAAATFVLEEVQGIQSLPWSSEQLDQIVQNWLLPCWALAVTGLLLYQTLRYPERRGRNQAGLVLAGTLPWLLTILALTTAPQLGMPPSDWLSGLESIALLSFPAALFAAIFRYHLFDIELMVRRSLIFGMLSGSLGLVFFAALAAAGTLMPGPLQRNASAWVIGAAALLLGLLFAPLRRFLHGLIDRRFFPERYELRQRLIALSSELAALVQLPLMGEHLVNRLAAIFASSSATVLIASPETGSLKVLASSSAGIDRALLLALDDPGIELLESAARPVLAAQVAARSLAFAHRFPHLGPAGLLVPLMLSPERLVGVLAVGEKPGGELYPAEEKDLLMLLAHHVAAVLENARLFESATYEALTGLLRREAILEQLERELERAVRYDRPLTIAMADLDHFKEINDRYGHLGGDTLLKRISQAAAEGLRSTDSIGRYGGEEFLVVLPETDLTGAAKVAEKIRHLVQRTAVQMEDGTLARVTISIGLAALAEQPRGAHPGPRDLIAAADRSLYQAKHRGRNRIHPLLVA